MPIPVSRSVKRDIKRAVAENKKRAMRQALHELEIMVMKNEIDYSFFEYQKLPKPKRKNLDIVVYIGQDDSQDKIIDFCSTYQDTDKVRFLLFNDSGVDFGVHDYKTEFHLGAPGTLNYSLSYVTADYITFMSVNDNIDDKFFSFFEK